MPKIASKICYGATREGTMLDRIKDCLAFGVIVAGFWALGGEVAALVFGCILFWGWPRKHA